MANLYLDHGVHGAYAATPTWNTPQEGDGKASGVGTCALGSIVFTQGHSAGSLAIFGAAVTPATSADADAAANNAATAINAATTTINTTFGSGRAPQVRNVVFARGPAGGAPAGTCQIMTRVAAASLNDGATNTSITQSGYDGTIPTLTQFAGAASGAYSYAMNSAAVWPQALASPTYGVFNNSTLIGLISPGDVVYIRTKRAGANISASFAGAAVTFDTPDGPVTSPIKYIADNGVVWAGDAGIFTVFSSATGVVTFRSATGAADSSKSCLFVGTKLTDLTRNFVFRQDNGYGSFNFLLGQNSRFLNVHFIKGTTSFTQPFRLRFNGALNGSNNAAPFGPTRVERCVIEQIGANQGSLLLMQEYSGVRVVFDDCDFVEPDTAAVASGIVGINSTNDIGMVHYEFRNCRAQGFIAGSGFGGKATNNGATSAKARVFALEDCALGNVTLFDFGMTSRPAANLIATNASDARMNPDTTHRAIVTSRKAGRAYYYETVSHTIEWRPTSTWPLLRAQLPEAYNGAEDRWVYRLVTAPGAVETFARANPFEVARLTKYNTLATAVRTMELEFLVDQTIDTSGAPLQKSEVVIEARYVDDTGAVRIERSFDVYGGTDGNATASLAAWSATQYDVAGVAHLYNKRKASLTTAYPVATGSEVYISVLVGRPSPTVDDWYFIDPEVSMT